MPEPMEGPFAAKLKAATEGRDFPKASIDALAVSQGLDLSGGGKTGREKRRAKHERREQEEREGVSGRSVHTRGHFAEARSGPTTPEIVNIPDRHEMLVRLVDQINAADGRLQELFQAYPDAAPSVIETDDSGKEVKVDLRTAVAETFASAGRDVMAYEGAADGTLGEEDLENLVNNLSDRLAEMEEAENRFRESVSLSKTDKEGLIGKEDRQQESGGETASAGPSVSETGSAPIEARKYASFGQAELRELWRGFSHEDMLSAVERQLADWKKFDQGIREFHDEERLLGDIRTAEGGENPEEVIRLTGRSQGIAETLSAIRKRFEENGKLDKKDAGTLTALFYPYHDLLVAAERIMEERARETPIVEAEKNENEIVASLKSNQERVLRRLRAIKTREEFEQYKKEDMAGGTTTIAEIDADGLRHFLGDKYSENDERLVGKLLQLAKNLQGEIVTSYREVEKKFSGMPAPQSLETAAVNGEIQENHEAKIREPFGLKVTRLKTLLTEWEALEKEFGDQSLRQAIRKLRQLERGKPLPPTGKIAKWFAEHDGPKAWQGRNATADRALLMNDALPSMEGMVRDGLVAAEKLRAEREVAEAAPTPAPVAPEARPERVEPIARGDVWDAPAAKERNGTSIGRRAVVTGVLGDGKIAYRFFDVDDLGNAANMGFGSAIDETAMREWLSSEGFAYTGRREDELDPPAASVLTLDRRPVIDGELTEWERMNPVEQNRLRRELFSRKDRFVTGLNEQLKRAGVNDADRRNTVIKYLDEYLPQMISLVVKVPLQETDRESLLRDLKKEIAIA